MPISYATLFTPDLLGASRLQKLNRVNDFRYSIILGNRCSIQLSYGTAAAAV